MREICVKKTEWCGDDRLCANGDAQITDKKKPTMFPQWVNLIPD